MHRSHFVCLMEAKWWGNNCFYCFALDIHGPECPVLWIRRALPLSTFHRKTFHSRKRKMMKTNQSFIRMWSWDSYYFSICEFILPPNHLSSDSFILLSFLQQTISIPVLAPTYSWKVVYLPKDNIFFFIEMMLNAQQH